MLAVATFKLARTGAGSCNPGWSRPARVRICTLIAFSWDDSSWSNGASDSTTLSSPKLDAAHGKKAATSITEECKNTRAQHARRGKVRFAGREVDWFLLMGSWCPLGKADLDPPLTYTTNRRFSQYLSRLLPILLSFYPYVRDSTRQRRNLVRRCPDATKSPLTAIAAPVAVAPAQVGKEAGAALWTLHASSVRLAHTGFTCVPLRTLYIATSQIAQYVRWGGVCSPRSIFSMRFSSCATHNLFLSAHVDLPGG